MSGTLAANLRGLELTPEYLSGLKPEEHAALIQRFDKAVRDAEVEAGRAGEVERQRRAELSRLEAETQEKYGKSTPEDLTQIIEAKTAEAAELWAKVVPLLEPAG